MPRSLEALEGSWSSEGFLAIGDRIGLDELTYESPGSLARILRERNRRDLVPTRAARVCDVVFWSLSSESPARGTRIGGVPWGKKDSVESRSAGEGWRFYAQVDVRERLDLFPEVPADVIQIWWNEEQFEDGLWGCDSSPIEEPGLRAIWKNYDDLEEVLDAQEWMSVRLAKTFIRTWDDRSFEARLGSDFLGVIHSGLSKIGGFAVDYQSDALVERPGETCLAVVHGCSALSLGDCIYIKRTAPLVEESAEQVGGLFLRSASINILMDERGYLRCVSSL
jgi:hypothetical protein